MSRATRILAEPAGADRQGARFWPSAPLAPATARPQMKANERGPTGTKPLNYGKPPRRRRRRRTLLVMLALLLLLGVAGGLLVEQTGAWRLALRTGIFGLNSPATTTVSSDAATEATQTAQALAQTTPNATATTAPTATSAATATTTTQPQPVLSIAPEPLTLTASGPKNACSATQIIRNSATQTVGWYWNGPTIAGLQFAINGKAPVAWPKDTTPGIAPGKQDSVAIVMNRCQSFSRTITLTDTRGATYTFKLQASSGG